MNVLDLFSGIGGFSLGLERAGFETVAFCEINPFCRTVLQKHWPSVPIFSDVRALDAETLSAHGICSVDVICGGFPCQDASVANTGSNGPRKGIHGERTGLWKEIKRLATEFPEAILFLENVPGLLSAGFGVVLGDLASIGYDAEWFCVRASEVGLPHRRERLIVVAYACGSRWQRPFEDKSLFLSARLRHSPSLATKLLMRGVSWTVISIAYEVAMGFPSQWSDGVYNAAETPSPRKSPKSSDAPSRKAL